MNMLSCFHMIFIPVVIDLTTDQDGKRSIDTIFSAMKRSSNFMYDMDMEYVPRKKSDVMTLDLSNYWSECPIYAKRSIVSYLQRNSSPIISYMSVPTLNEGKEGADTVVPLNYHPVTLFDFGFVHSHGINVHMS